MKFLRTKRQSVVDKMPNLGESVSDAHSTYGMSASIRDSSMGAALQVAAQLKVLLGKDKRIVAVADMVLNDGSTKLAAKLGTAMAKLENDPVLVMDGNFQSPGIHKEFNVPREPGMSDIIEGNQELGKAVHVVNDDGLSVVSIGTVHENCVSLLSSSNTESTFGTLRNRFRYILIDVGPLLSSPESMLLASASDGLIAALACGIRRRHEVLKFQKQMEIMKIPLLGILLTKGTKGK